MEPDMTPVQEANELAALGIDVHNLRPATVKLSQMVQAFKYDLANAAWAMTCHTAKMFHEAAGHEFYVACNPTFGAHTAVFEVLFPTNRYTYRCVFHQPSGSWTVYENRVLIHHLRTVQEAPGILGQRLLAQIATHAPEEHIAIVKSSEDTTDSYGIQR